jgi:hypothetical protein
MPIPNDSLRIHLIFLDELKQVEVLAATNPFDSPPLRMMGVVEGQGQVEDMLDRAGVDCYIICSGEPLTPTFKAAAFERSPKLIVEDLNKGFERAEELQRKIIGGGELTDQERSFRAPISLTVCASCVKTDQGLERVRAWFKANRT